MKDSREGIVMRGVSESCTFMNVSVIWDWIYFMLLSVSANWEETYII